MISGQNTIGESRKADGVRISGRFPSLGTSAPHPPSTPPPPPPALLSPAHPERLRRLRPAAQGVLLSGVALRPEAPRAGCGAWPQAQARFRDFPFKTYLGKSSQISMI